MPDGQSGPNRVNQQTTPPGQAPGGSSQPNSAHAGYLTLEEAAQRKAETAAGAVVGLAGIAYAVKHATEDLAANAAVAGGGFKMDIDSMNSLLPQWRAIEDELYAMSQDAQVLSSLQPPAGDPGSKLQIKATHSHADAYLTSIQQQYNYAKGYADQLQKAIDSYGQQDQANHDRLRKQG